GLPGRRDPQGRRHGQHRGSTGGADHHRPAALAAPAAVSEQEPRQAQPPRSAKLASRGSPPYGRAPRAAGAPVTGASPLCTVNSVVPWGESCPVRSGLVMWSAGRGRVVDAHGVPRLVLAHRIRDSPFLPTVVSR